MNEIDLEFNKIIYFFLSIENLEFQKCYSIIIALMFTFEILKIVFPGTKTDSIICVEV